MAKDFDNHAGNEFYKMFNTLTSNVAFKLIMNFAYRTFCPTGSTSTISQSSSGRDVRIFHFTVVELLSHSSENGPTEFAKIQKKNIYTWIIQQCKLMAENMMEDYLLCRVFLVYMR